MIDPTLSIELEATRAAIVTAPNPLRVLEQEARRLALFDNFEPDEISLDSARSRSISQIARRWSISYGPEWRTSPHLRTGMGAMWRTPRTERTFAPPPAWKCSALQA